MRHEAPPKSPLLLGGEVPKGWTLTQLGDVAEISGGTTPRRSEASYWGGDLPWARPSDLTARKPGRMAIEKTEEQMTEAALADTSVSMLPAGSILMTSRATIGEVAINTVPMATNQGFCNFVPQGQVDPRFLAYWLVGNKRRFERLASGSTFTELSKRDARQVRIHLPPLHEQQQIASLLMRIDRVIATCNDIIEQSGYLQEGVREEVLYRGVGHEELVKTPAGRIPATWQVEELRDLAGQEGLFSDGDWVETKHQDPDGEVRLIQLADIGSGRFLDKSHRFLTADTAEEIGCTFLERGDVLAARMPDPIGRACVFPGVGQPAVTAVDVTILRPRPSVNRAWLVNLLNSRPVLSRVQRYVTGTTRNRISRSNLGNIKIPVPPSKDQASLGALFGAVDQVREQHRTQLSVLRRLKVGLMQHLLSGRIRISSA